MPSPTVVCFDLGGVLIRICRNWAEGCVAAGVPVRGTWEPERDPTLHELVHEHQTGTMDGDTWALRLSDHLDGLYSTREILAVHEAWTYGEYGDVRDIIERLHELDVVTAVLSNTNAEHWAMLLEMPVVQAVRHHVASHVIGLVKPDPAAYRAVEDAVGASGDDILFFDDLEPNVAAADSLGWRTVHVDPHEETAPQIREGLGRHGIQ